MDDNAKQFSVSYYLMIFAGVYLATFLIPIAVYASGNGWVGGIIILAPLIATWAVAKIFVGKHKCEPDVDQVKLFQLWVFLITIAVSVIIFLVQTYLPYSIAWKMASVFAVFINPIIVAMFLSKYINMELKKKKTISE